MDWALLILNILLIFFVVYSLIKFSVFFFVKYDTRRKLLDSSYNGKTTATKISDIFSFEHGNVITHIPIFIGKDRTSEFYNGTSGGNGFDSIIFPQFFRTFKT